jgi:hypothetical protein
VGLDRRTAPFHRFQRGRLRSGGNVAPARMYPWAVPALRSRGSGLEETTILLSSYGIAGVYSQSVSDPTHGEPSRLRDFLLRSAAQRGRVHHRPCSKASCGSGPLISPARHRLSVSRDRGSGTSMVMCVQPVHRRTRTWHSSTTRGPGPTYGTVSRSWASTPAQRAQCRASCGCIDGQEAENLAG